MEYIIKKLGGENAAELHKSAHNIYDDYKNGRSQAVVVSAIRTSDFNTTDKLINLGKLLQNNEINIDSVVDIIQQLQQFHLDILEEKLLCSKQDLITIVQKQFEVLEGHIRFYIGQNRKHITPDSSNDYSIEISDGIRFSILGFGEVVSCKIISGVIDTISLQGICSKSIDLSNLIIPGEMKGKSSGEIFDILSHKIGEMIEQKVSQGYIPVLSGYIGSFEDGIEAAIGRGYSDSTAGITTVGLAERGHDVILEVQKSVPGLMSADPRVLDDPTQARVIDRLDYLTAREITGDTGAQAKLLHHQALSNRVQESGVRIHLFDPFSDMSAGTWIEPDLKIEAKSKNHCGIEFVGGRTNVIFFSISSGKMFEKNILGRLFVIVKDYFSVDIVSASETEVTFTVDGNGGCDDKLKAMSLEIKQEFGIPDNSSMEFIEYKKNKTLIFCVGPDMRGHVGLMSRATKALGDNGINIELSSQGRLQRAMIFGLDVKDMKKAVNVLHREFIKN